MRRLLTLLLCLALLVGATAFGARASSGGAALGCTPVTDLDGGLLSNIELAAYSISGYFLPYGSYFSFNDIVGPRTEACGYLPAPNGRGVEVVGGGVGQVASTMYMALESMGGIEFDSLAFYGDDFSASYVDSGDEAVLVDDASGIDFSFYNYAQDLCIELYTDGEYVYCSIAPASVSASWNTSESKSAHASLCVSGTEALRSNIALACGSIYDVTLGSGDKFSFNELVGPRTAEYGYLPAVNGRGVDVVGGGVGQVASVLYLAAKDLPCVSIAEKSAYGSRYNQNYVANPSDAVLVDYASGVDFTFAYTGDGCLTIYVYLDGDTLTCELLETTSW